MNKILNRLEGKLDAPGILPKITSKLSNSEVNSLSLELFRQLSGKLKPADLLRQFQQNRFTLVSGVDAIEYKTYELEWLKQAAEIGFQPLQLSPVAPLGTCSVVGLVDQNNIVSSTRSTEVVSDATNFLALRIATDFQKDKSRRTIKYCTAHRHTRAQHFTNPAFSAHFGAFCMVTGGLDSGNDAFEIDNLKKHLRFYCERLLSEFSEGLVIKFCPKRGIRNIGSVHDDLRSLSPRIRIVDNVEDEARDYYQTARVRVYLDRQKEEINIADMRFVDWTQKLLNNRKHRLLISGTGLELAFKMKAGMI